MEAEISAATKRNWERLNTNGADRLTARANKRGSKRSFLPTEYFSDRGNVRKTEKIVDYILKTGTDAFAAVYSVCVKQLKLSGIFDLPHVQRVLSEYRVEADEYLLSVEYPEGEHDLAGLIYQGILTEGEKNRRGSYYTPRAVAENMLSAADLEHGGTFLDPCCGSGAFLTAQNADPRRIFGVDNDPIAVFICKVNLLLKYPGEEFLPQIYCADFLREDVFSGKAFDCIITNPPWGAVCGASPTAEITSGEAFSHFFVKSFGLLRAGGIMRFLFPQAVLNVKAHRDIRQFMLSNGDISAITLYDGMFSGVSTKYVDIEFSKKHPGKTVNIYSSKGVEHVARQGFFATKNLVFAFCTKTDEEIIERVRRRGCHTLCESTWALGIVTGDNKRKLLTEHAPGSEPIYTGAEISPYILKKPAKYIVYDRTGLQQAAREEIYRAREKLAYKFISDKLVFAYDNSGALFLNSANLLIPRLPGMSIKTVLAFLNSNLYRYLYRVLFGEIKILKGNLNELPFPDISAEEDAKISAYADRVLAGEAEYIPLIQTEVYGIFGLEEELIRYIEGV